MAPANPGDIVASADNVSMAGDRRSLASSVNPNSNGTDFWMSTAIFGERAVLMNQTKMMKGAQQLPFVLRRLPAIAMAYRRRTSSYIAAHAHVISAASNSAMELRLT